MEDEELITPLSHYPPSVINEVLDRVAGGEALQIILASDAKYPKKHSWYRGIAADMDLSQRYVRAVQLQIASRWSKSKEM